MGRCVARVDSFQIAQSNSFIRIPAASVLKSRIQAMSHSGTVFPALLFRSSEELWTMRLRLGQQREIMN
jgi:hypothetical protein